MLLRVVANPRAVAQENLAGVRRVDPGKHAQQRCLASSVKSQYDDPGSTINGKINIRENLLRPVRTRQPPRHQGCLAAGGRLGETDLGNTIGHAAFLEVAHQAIGALQHGLRCLGLGGLSAHLLGLFSQ